MVGLPVVVEYFLSINKGSFIDNSRSVKRERVLVVRGERPPTLCV